VLVWLGAASAGYRMGKDVAQRRITLARVSLLEKD